MKVIICIVSFRDDETNSIAYQKFEDIDKAVEFYRKQLLKDTVRVISTRKVMKENTYCMYCGKKGMFDS